MIRLKDFHDKEIPQVGANYVFLQVIYDFVLKNMKTIIHKCF